MTCAATSAWQHPDHVDPCSANASEAGLGLRGVEVDRRRNRGELELSAREGRALRKEIFRWRGGELLDPLQCETSQGGTSQSGTVALQITVGP
jgi:hypothetical protein